MKLKNIFFLFLIVCIGCATFGDNEFKVEKSVFKKSKFPAGKELPKDMTLKEIDEVIRGANIDLGKGIVLTANDPIGREAKFTSKEKRLVASYYYGSFRKTGNRSASYSCPNIGDIEFSISHDSITYEMNDIAVDKLKEQFAVNVKSKRTVKR